MSQKYEEEDLEEDLESFVAAYNLGRGSVNPFTPEAEVHEIDKKLVQLQSPDSNEEQLKSILEKIRAKGAQ